MKLEELAKLLNMTKPPKLPDALDEIERRVIIATIAATRGSQSGAATKLGIAESSLRTRMKSLGIKSTREQGIELGRPLKKRKRGQVRR